MVYKDSFLKACEEYNAFGSAVSNKKIRVEQNLAVKLYGLKDRHLLSNGVIY